MLGLGGTISMTDTVGGDARPMLRVADLLGAGGDDIVVETRDVRVVPGAHLEYQDVFMLAREIARAYRSGHAGVVIVQGTDTIEEVAYALTLLVADPVAVVVTGAMRTASAAGPDGPANVAAAVAVAVDPRCRDLGVLVVLGDVIHSAELVRKTATTAPDAFQSWPGPLGYLSEGQPHLDVRPIRRRRVISVPEHPPPSRVEIVTATFGAGADSLGRLVSDPPDAVVVAGFGGGHVPPSWVGPLSDLSAHRPVVLTSRVGTGRALTRTYAFPGSEHDLLGHGLIPGGRHDPIKATVALHVLLAADSTQNDVQTFFDD